MEIQCILLNTVNLVSTFKINPFQPSTCSLENVLCQNKRTTKDDIMHTTFNWKVFRLTDSSVCFVSFVTGTKEEESNRKYCFRGYTHCTGTHFIVVWMQQDRQTFCIVFNGEPKMNFERAMT